MSRSLGILRPDHLAPDGSVVGCMLETGEKKSMPVNLTHAKSAQLAL